MILHVHLFLHQSPTGKCYQPSYELNAPQGDSGQKII